MFYVCVWGEVTRGEQHSGSFPHLPNPTENRDRGRCYFKITLPLRYHWPLFRDLFFFFSFLFDAFLFLASSHERRKGGKGKEKKKQLPDRYNTCGKREIPLSWPSPTHKRGGSGNTRRDGPLHSFFFFLFFFHEKMFQGKKGTGSLTFPLTPTNQRERGWCRDSGLSAVPAGPRPVEPSTFFFFFFFFFPISSGSRITYFIPSVLNHGWKPPKPNRNQTLGVAKRKQKVSKWHVAQRGIGKGKRKRKEGQKEGKGGGGMLIIIIS